MLSILSSIGRTKHAASWAFFFPILAIRGRFGRKSPLFIILKNSNSIFFISFLLVSYFESCLAIVLAIFRKSLVGVSIIFFLYFLEEIYSVLFLHFH
jgi:hypothetical protein